ncbi:MAG TPA: tetratricopeptide repeat protein [Burkholderiales bacterium]|nr:tetratricopeptide repeat protein [Burkholderiales bacterium]
MTHLGPHSRADKEVEDLLRRATAAHRQGRLLQAELLYEQVLDGAREHASAHHLLGVLKFQRGEVAEALAHFDRALHAAPRFTDAHNSLGNALLATRKPAEALASFERGLHYDPRNADLLCGRGAALQALGRHFEAVESLKHAQLRGARGASVAIDLGVSLRALGHEQEALECFERALALEPGSAPALSNRGNALAALGRLDEAIASHRRAVEQAPADAQARLNLALAELAAGDWERGWRSYAGRDLDRDAEGRRREFAQPLWRGDGDVRGRTVLLHAEQGFGDTLMFARYVPLLAARGARVLLEVQPRLKALMRDTRGATQIAARGEPLPAFDLHCPLPDLPLAFGTTPDRVPPPLSMTPPAEIAARWAQRLAPLPRPRVGIVWGGNPAFARDRSRSIDLERMAALLPEVGAQFVSLQKEVSDADRAVLAHHGIPHTGPEQRDFGDAAALVAQMDAVVSVDTAVAHLAGNMGKPVFLLLASAPDWRWMRGRDDCVWYPRHRLYRQPGSGKGGWDEPLRRVAAALREAVRT